MDLTKKLSALHDAELQAISLGRDGATLQMNFLEPDGSGATLTLGGLAAFRLIDMGTQNVVSRMLVQGCNIRWTAPELGEVATWIWRTSDGEQLAGPSRIGEINAKLQNGELLLVVLEPSWGAELRAICATLDLQF